MLRGPPLTVGSGNADNETMIRRVIILCAVLALVISGLFPPYIEHSEGINYRSPGTFTRTAGYHSIFKPPARSAQWSDSPYPNYEEQNVTFYVGRERLLLEWLFVILVTAGLVLAARSPGKKSAG